MSRKVEKKLADQLLTGLCDQGLKLCKSRRTGGFMIVNAFTNTVEAGELHTCLELNLDDVERFVKEP